MKNHKLFTIAPVLALMAVGCSSPIAMQSTEYDDMYYTSSDQTNYVEPEATVYQRYNENSTQTEEALAEGEVLNPEYAGSNARTDNYNGDEYYDGRDYNPRNNWYQPSYSFVDPYWGAAYAPRMSSYAYHDPFYDPFFDDPFYYNSFRRSPYWGWNRGLNVSLSYGMGMGMMGMPMAWGGPMMGMGGWWPDSYGYGYYNGFRNGFNNGFYGNPYLGYGGNPYYGIYDRPVVIGQPMRVQNSPRGSRSAVVTDNPTLRRATRGGVNQGEGADSQTLGTQRVGRPARSGETATSPSRNEGNVVSTEGEKAVLPSRPARPVRARQGEPALNQQRQQQQQSASPTPTRTERRTRTQEYRQPQQQQQRSTPTRTYESRPTRTYESAPTRTYESSPSRTYESSPQRSSGSSSGSSGGSRPRRGGN